jgi:(p)ppGpp synthase/HD superfamily hydrolase
MKTGYTKIFCLTSVIPRVMDRLDIPQISKHEFLDFLQDEGKVRLDDYIEGAVEVAEEVHSGLMREDGTSPFLETHTWPVTMDVVRHYRSANRNITSVEVATAILHDVMEDDERILNLHESKSYGFEAYLAYRFGSRIGDIASELKIRPLENYAGITDNERQLERFLEYCDILREAEYDVKVIKLADRLNNMLFISHVPGHDKIRRYMREAEDFYIAYTMLPPKMPHFYPSIRAAYERLRILSPQKMVAA